MRTLFIGVLAANLVGCAALHDSRPVVVKAHAQNAGPTKSNPPIRRANKAGKKTKAVAQKASYAMAGKAAPLPPTSLNGPADPVTEQAKASIAAKLENPASAEFTQLRRAIKKLLNNSHDTVCGYVKGKTASGEDTAEMPFLYLVDDGRDGAYLVDGKSQVSDAVHSAFCK